MERTAGSAAGRPGSIGSARSATHDLGSTAGARATAGAGASAGARAPDSLGGATEHLGSASG